LRGEALRRCLPPVSPMTPASHPGGFRAIERTRQSKRRPVIFAGDAASFRIR
jgi:hypothetical protein